MALPKGVITVPRPVTLPAWHRLHGGEYVNPRCRWMASGNTGDANADDSASSNTIATASNHAPRIGHLTRTRKATPSESSR